jgi:hypothetical protein
MKCKENLECDTQQKQQRKHLATPPTNQLQCCAAITPHATHSIHSSALNGAWNHIAWSSDVINCSAGAGAQVSRFPIQHVSNPQTLIPKPECGGLGTAMRGGGSWRCPASSRCGQESQGLALGRASGFGFWAGLGFRVCSVKTFTWRKQRRNDADDSRWSPGGRRGLGHLHASKPS